MNLHCPQRVPYSEVPLYNCFERHGSTDLSPGCHHTQRALKRTSDRNSRPLYGNVRLMGVVKVVTFDNSLLNIWTERMGVATVRGSLASDWNR